MGSIRIWESSKGRFYICFKKASGKAEAGIGAMTVAKGSDVVGDMAAKEGGIVTTEEESITITCSAKGEGARWIEISTTGRDDATMAREADDRTVKIGGTERGSN